MQNTEEDEEKSSDKKSYIGRRGEIVEMWQAGKSIAEICGKLGCARVTAIKETKCFTCAR